MADASVSTTYAKQGVVRINKHHDTMMIEDEEFAAYYRGSVGVRSEVREPNDDVIIMEIIELDRSAECGGGKALGVVVTAPLWPEGAPMSRVLSVLGDPPSSSARDFRVGYNPTMPQWPSPSHAHPGGDDAAAALFLFQFEQAYYSV
jgi:hypothetical protein